MSDRPLTGGTAARPVAAEEMAAAMAALGPFENEPLILAGVSGGGDSLALACLLDDWCRARGGRLVAATVDHGLRPEAAAEAAGVAATLGRLGIEHRVLAGAVDRTVPGGLQASARRLRHRLLGGLAEGLGALHLALGHNLEDRAETLLLRLKRGSGLDGLAALAPVVELSGYRLLRPLLGFSRARLRASLEARGLAWIEDPSNADPRFDRSRLRAAGPLLGELGLGAARLATAAAALGAERAAAERATARLAARAVTFDGLGGASLDRRALLAAEPALARRLLRWLLMALGEGAPGPRQASLDRLLAWIGGEAGGQGGGVRTLAGCLLLLEAGRLGIYREPAAICATALPLEREATLLWDKRVEIRAGPDFAPGQALTVAPLETVAWKRLKAQTALLEAALPRYPGPAVARAAQPAVFGRGGVLALPSLGWAAPGFEAAAVSARWRGVLPATPPGFTLA